MSMFNPLAKVCFSWQTYSHRGLNGVYGQSALME